MSYKIIKRNEERSSEEQSLMLLLSPNFLNTQVRLTHFNTEACERWKFKQQERHEVWENHIC